VSTRVHAGISRLAPDSAQDIVQEAFARALRHRVPGDLEPWLRTVTRRIAIDNARRRREYPRGDANDIDRIRPTTIESPEDIVVAREGVGLIRRALRSLPRRYREALVTYSQHPDHATVAAEMGLSTSGARTLVCRARLRLRAELERVGYAASVLAMKLDRFQRVVATSAAAGCVAAVAAVSAPTVPVAPAEAVSPVFTAASAAAGAAPAQRVVPVAVAHGRRAVTTPPGHSGTGSPKLVEALQRCDARGQALPATGDPTGVLAQTPLPSPGTVCRR
jgi:RNA polymerase sigma factor (sigma-70 family)